MKTKQFITNDSAYTTRFEYDAINQLVVVIDDAGKKTISEYDMAGRRTKLTHPASGVTTFGYDAASNLLWKFTANNDSIKYGYKYNRLERIEYPRYPENNVTYTFGDDTPDNRSNNRVGRLVSLEDGSGAQAFKYGKQGEVAEVRRTLVIPNQAVATYVTKTTYDSWNRLLSMTYPDGEVVNYSYNVGGLLTGIVGNKPGEEATVYVKNVKYDEFEQRTSLQYGNGLQGNGSITTYSYDPKNRQLQNLIVSSNGKGIMNNTYNYDKVGNIERIENIGEEMNAANTISGKIGGKITHNYHYDNLYRLDSASGVFNQGAATYNLKMQYDNMHNITSKNQHISQSNVQFGGTLNAGYMLKYTINGNNSQQISNIADENYRYVGDKLAAPPAEALKKQTQEYAYDANGNLISIQTGTKTTDQQLQVTKSRRLLWDEENRLLGISDNGFVSQYWYDASGERTVKESFDNEGVYINGALSGAHTGTSKFTAYVSPYLVVSNGGNYTKHVYMGSQRITSKVSNSGIFTTSPINDTLQAKYTQQTTKIKERFDSLGVAYSGLEQTGGLVSLSPPAGDIGGCYFYHPDHLGSSSLITDGNGHLVQHIQYVPFGEVFIEQRNSTWSTPYKFNGKELDEETGLAYYHARYYDPRTSVWLSVDPLAEKYIGYSSYVYCLNNPVLYVDPDGKQSMFGWSRGLTSKQTNEVVAAWGKAYQNVIHPTLDIAGMIPVIGEVADGVNGLIYLAQGDKTNAFLCFSACVPLVGWATTSSKWLSKSLSNSIKVDAKAINKLYGKAPYDEAFDIIQGVTKNNAKFVRVHGKNNAARSWMMNANDIKGLSPKEIQEKFALPEVPTFISEILVPEGTNIRVGVAAAVDGWGKGGGVQVEVLDRVQESWILSTKELK